ncbi:MAG: S41 family peptidase [Bacteroidota bacterium]
MKLFKRLLFFPFLLCNLYAFCQQGNFDPAQRFTVEQLRSDLSFLKTKLERKHPNLYLYTPKASFNIFFDSLYRSITAPLIAQEFYHHISVLNSVIKDGHTMFLPGEKLTAYYNQHEKFLPFFFFVSSNRLYIRMNCSGDPALKEGTEISSINGVSTADLLSQLVSRQIRDGYSNTYPEWLLTNYFAAYYGFSFGHPQQYSIGYKNNSAEKLVTINALAKDSIAYYKKLRYPAKAIPSAEGRGVFIDISQPSNTAILTIKSFNDDILKVLYHQDFKSSISNAFDTLRKSAVANLIIDLRDNQGGDFKPGMILLSYLLNQPVDFLPGSSQSKTITPRKDAYNGKLYLLVNGGSFSNSGIVSSYLELTKRAVFIGEETAGGHIIISGEPRDFILPNTRIIAEISTRQFRIQQQGNDGRGIIPQYQVIPTIDDIINDRDPVKTFAFNLISNNVK